MGLFDFFKPRWKHSDPKIRNEAIKKLDDQDTLLALASSDDNLKVRVRAAGKLQDQTFLSKLLQNSQDEDVRCAATKNIDDKKLIIDLATSDEMNDVRLAAVERIDDQELLAKIALSDDYWLIRKTAAERINDEKKLVDVANETTDLSVRKIAFETIRKDTVLFERLNQEALSNFILESKDGIPSSLQTIIEKNLTNQKVLARRMVSAGYIRIPESAAAFLTDQRAVEIICNHAQSEYARCENEELLNNAIELLQDQQKLANIFHTYKNNHDAYMHGIPLAALDRITDQDVLKRIASEEESRETIFKHAIAKITDLDFLVPYIKRVESYTTWTGDAAAKRIIYGELTDDPLIIEKIINYVISEDYLTEKAIEKLTDQDILKRIATNHPDRSTSRMAKKRLENLSNNNNEQSGRDLADVETADDNNRSIGLTCPECQRKYQISGVEGETVQCPYCKAVQENLENAPSVLTAGLVGLPYGTIVCNCAYCHKKNCGIMVRDKFWANGSFYSQTIDDPDGKFHLKTKCIHCEKEYHIAWDVPA